MNKNTNAVVAALFVFVANIDMPSAYWIEMHGGFKENRNKVDAHHQIPCHVCEPIFPSITINFRTYLTNGSASQKCPV